MRQPAVYLLASKRNGTLYAGVTSNLLKRVWEHRNNLVEGFTKRYGVHRLVYFELHGEMAEAIEREKQIKKWNRAWKIELIEKSNPEWRDLWPSLVGDESPEGHTGASGYARSPGDGPACESRRPASREDLDSRFRGNDGARGEP